MKRVSAVLAKTHAGLLIGVTPSSLRRAWYTVRCKSLCTASSGIWHLSTNRSLIRASHALVTHRRA